MKKMLLFQLLITGILSAQWVQQTSNTTAALNAVFFTDSVTGIIVGSGGTILKTTDAGVNWIPMSGGNGKILHDVAFSGKYSGIAVGYKVILKTTDGGESWTAADYPRMSFNGVAMIDSLTALAVGDSISDLGVRRILKTTDGGSSWYQVYSGGNFTLNKISFAGYHYGLAVGTGGCKYKTTTSGDTWTYIEGSYTGGADLFCVSYNDPDNAFAGSFGISKTTDGGMNWLPVYSPTMGGIYSLFFPEPAGGIAVGFQGASGSALIVKSKDGGQSWTEMSAPPLPALYDVYFTDMNNGTAVGMNGTIIHTDNGGLPVEFTSFRAVGLKNSVELNWTTASETNNRGFEVERRFGDQDWVLRSFISGSGTTNEIRNYSFLDNTSLQGKYSYRLKQIDFNGNSSYSEIIDIIFTYTPDEFSLHQNYPNPFNPSTNISWSLPLQSHTQLIIYDALGREVCVLVDEEKTSGTYMINFDASDLPGGIYFYQFRAGEFRETRKMILLK